MFDIVSLAEAVIDFSMCGKGPMGNPAFEMNPGGAGCNVALPNALLGGKSACLGLVGKDMFGDHIIRRLKELNINTEGMRQTGRSTTRLSFVSIDEDGDRQFDFVKGSGMKPTLSEEDIDFSIIAQGKVFLTEYCHEYKAMGAETIFKAIRYAKDHGAKFGMDFNYRPNVFADDQEGIAYLKEILEYADYVKVSENEMAMLTGLNEDEYERGAKAILSMDKEAVFVTMGPGGSYFATKDGDCGFVEAFKVKAVDTTGCGDAFFGTVLHYMTRENPLPMAEIVRRANAYGALCALKPGAFDAMPTKEELETFLAEHK